VPDLFGHRFLPDAVRSLFCAAQTTLFYLAPVLDNRPIYKSRVAISASADRMAAADIKGTE
jgi:hypothetical protein